MQFFFCTSCHKLRNSEDVFYEVCFLIYHQILSLSQRQMTGVKCKFQKFENVLYTLLTNRAFHVQKPMNTLSFVAVQTTNKV
jgi:hypothetical protein